MIAMGIGENIRFPIQKNSVFHSKGSFLARLVLCIITSKSDLVITECQTQRDMKRLAGVRSICLNAFERQ